MPGTMLLMSVWRSCLDHGSAGVEGQRMGELTDGGGVRSGDEEDGSEELENEHGDVGDVSTGWLVSSKGIHPRFYIFPASMGSPALDLLLSARLPKWEYGPPF
jgi:hypothetical protein